MRLRCPCLFRFGVLILLAAVPSVAFARTTGAPLILSRADWGADEQLGVMSGAPVINSPPSSAPRRIRHVHTEKEQKCREARRRAPEDFRTVRVESMDHRGQSLKWPRRYSEDVKLIVVHHTGENETPETHALSGIDRVRAIYQYHTLHNGWGDIGYHYLVDDDGVIYEGRAGGRGVVGAHVYCANVGTIGVALIGNLQHRDPTESQLSSLRWLLIHLSKRYGINPRARVSFRGERVPAIAAHRDLANTQCAGRRIQSLLPNIRSRVANADYSSPMLFSASRSRRFFTIDDHSRENTASLSVASSRGSAARQNTIRSVDETTLHLTPRSAATLRLRYHAGARPVDAGEALATVVRSDRSIGLWQRRHGSSIRVDADVRAERALRLGEEAGVTLSLLAPKKPGTYTVHVFEGRDPHAAPSIRFTLEVVAVGS